MPIDETHWVVVAGLWALAGLMVMFMYHLCTLVAAAFGNDDDS